MDQTKTPQKRTYAKMFVGILTLALASIAGINGTANASQVYGGEPLSAWRPVTLSATSTEVCRISGIPGFRWIPSNDGETIEATERSSELGGILGHIFKGDRINIVHTRRAYTVRLQKYFGAYPNGRPGAWQDPVLVEPWNEGYKRVEELHRRYFRSTTTTTTLH